MKNNTATNEIFLFDPKSLPAQEKQTILDKLLILNENKRIKLRAKPIPTKASPNRHSLFLDFSRGGKRIKHSLRLYLDLGRNTKRKDNETLTKALELRDHHNSQLIQDEHNYKLPSKLGQGDFLEYFKKITDKQKAGSVKPYDNTYKYLKKFTKGKIAFNSVSKKFCNSFKEYLLSNVSQNTAHTYFSRLKAVLNLAVEAEYISDNPAKSITISKEDVQREFLTIEDLRTLNDTPCPNEQTKRAFIFSCYTGLRFSDIKNLTFDDIHGGYLNFRQKKTRGVDRIKLSENALEIVKIQKQEVDPEGPVFDLFGHDYTLKQIKKWVKKAGIGKHITWHSGRHTFATLALTYGCDLYTVSKLLGHKEIRSTQIYAKLIDKKKDEAIDRLPKI
jgi:integrase